MFLTKRRQFLGLSALLLLPSAMLEAGTRSAVPVLLSAASDADDKHWLIGFSLQQQSAQILYKQALPTRGHHVAVSQRHGIYVAIARRPGTWLVCGDLHTGAVHDELTVPQDRHLFGHGIFSADENFFYTTESNFSDMTGDNGLLVEWKVVNHQGLATLERQREFPTQGIGPHELLLMPDGKTLAIANGGMRTHPDSEREVLNADTMLPSLVYMDPQSGQILEQQFLPEQFHQASIRHMDVNAAGLIVMGLQFQGEPFADVPLLASHVRGAVLRLLAAPADIQPRMKQYVGSVRFSGNGQYFAASCPRGNLLTFWDSNSGELIKTLSSRDGCGLNASTQGFVFSSGTGRLAEINLETAELNEYDLPEQAQVFWDNHLSMAGVV